MLTPNLLALHAAAVLAQVPHDAKLRAEAIAHIDAHQKATNLLMDRVVNALEKADLQGVREAIESFQSTYDGAPIANEVEAFIDEVHDLAWPAPPTAPSPLTPAAVIVALATDPLPSQSTPASVPAPAETEPIPAVTPA